MKLADWIGHVHVDSERAVFDAYKVWVRACLQAEADQAEVAAAGVADVSPLPPPAAPLPPSTEESVQPPPPSADPVSPQAGEPPVEEPVPPASVCTIVVTFNQVQLACPFVCPAPALAHELLAVVHAELGLRGFALGLALYQGGRKLSRLDAVCADAPVIGHVCPGCERVVLVACEALLARTQSSVSVSEPEGVSCLAAGDADAVEAGPAAAPGPVPCLEAPWRRRVGWLEAR